MSRTSTDVDRPQPRVLRVFFDWGHVWPLWESGSDEYAMEPSDYGYSPALTEVLRQWQQAWVPIADFDLGETEEQPSGEAYQRYEDLARRVLAGILAETPGEVVISIEQHDAPRPDRLEHCEEEVVDDGGVDWSSRRMNSAVRWRPGSP